MTRPPQRPAATQRERAQGARGDALRAHAAVHARADEGLGAEVELFGHEHRATGYMATVMPSVESASWVLSTSSMDASLRTGGSRSRRRTSRRTRRCRRRRCTAGRRACPSPRTRGRGDCAAMTSARARCLEPKELEEVGAHAGDVADVVAHVVGDGRRVARVVLGDARLHLAGEVRADVRGLGVDAAAHAAEHGDGGAAEAEAGDALEAASPPSLADVEGGDVDAHQEVHDEQAEAQRAKPMTAPPRNAELNDSLPGQRRRA